MNIVGETFLRHCLKPRVECDLPGRLRMRFRHSEQLSKEALPYLHYVQDVLTMLPGVTNVTVNARIGTALVLYDAQTTSSRQILRWVDIVVDTGLEIAKEIKPEEVNEQKLEQVRQTTEQRLLVMQRQNAEKLDEMRGVVDEKLQRTLEERMTQSFRLVNERLEQVYKGLGEMQTLAAGVGDLKKVLSNVKTRGILGEIQLGSILREILAPEQYDENVDTRRGSR